MFLLKFIKVVLFVFFTTILLVSVSYAQTSYKVKSTDNLSRIVNKFYKNSDLSRHQIYIGILAENPHAFGLGNINYLYGKKVLNLPDSENLLAMEAVDAKKLVEEHNNYAKQGKKVKIAPPFEGYSPKKTTSGTTDINSLAEKQQAASQKLELLDSETESLRVRLDQLNADKEAMDAEIQQLNSLLKQ